tara:strand:+ start:284 stop:760 length:477 start_codon:yes stop_codon:yes gene_type:complete
MKKILLSFIVIFCFNSCVGIYLSDTLESPSNIKVAMLPTLQKRYSKDLGLTTKFQNALKDVGFQVVDYNIVNATAEDLGLSLKKELKLSEYRDLQNQLKCQAICLSIASFNSETLKIINYNTLDTYLEISVTKEEAGWTNFTASMTKSIIKKIKRTFN